jgi:drug/metabolite transporter (DMT)-like permease
LTAAVTAAIVSAEDRSARRRGQLFIALAALAWSTAGLLQRELSVDTPTQLAGRAFFAFLGLAAFVAVLSRGHPLRAFRAIGGAGIAVAVCTAIASGTFLVALNHATVANVLFMQAVAPIAAALLAWLALGEAVTRRAMLAMAIALVGVGLMVGGPGSGGALGIVASLAMVLAFAISIVITRHRRDVSMAPAICLSQLLVVAVAGPFAAPASATGRDVGLLALLGVGQMGLGLAFLTLGARLLPAAEVALITLLEVVLGPLWVWIAYGEEPAATTLAGGVVVMAAVVLQTTQRTQRDPGAESLRPPRRPWRDRRGRRGRRPPAPGSARS